MMKITLIRVGKLKEKYWIDAMQQYQKRLSRFVKLEVLQIDDQPLTQDSAGVQRARSLEAGQILRLLAHDDYCIALDIQGEQMDSLMFAQRVALLGIQGYSKVSMIIGGSSGLDKAVLERSQWRLSFSPMTFCHQMMPALVLEQLYRACKINAGESYHK